MTIWIISFSIVSYLIGSFSSAVWFGKWFWNTDVREFGSKNAGATNTLRVLGHKAAIPVFIADILKSYFAVQLTLFIPEIEAGTEFYYQIKLLFGVCAVIGHIFPLYSGFRGGKGVASMLGLLLALHPASAGICFGIFVLIFIPTRIVSVSSMSAALLFPLIIFILEKNEYLTLTIFSIIASALIILTHKKNIKRLLKGEEKRISFRKNP